jgi:DNA-binding beta-propeller fold protein YncE
MPNAECQMPNADAESAMPSPILCAMHDCLRAHRLVACAVAALLAAAALRAAPAQSPNQPRRGPTPPANAIPKFEVDPSFPKIPNNWQFGWVASVAVDAQDHVWVLQRPNSLPDAEKPRAAPPVLEFTADGTFVQAWGGPGAGYEWPESEHGIFVDQKGFVWIGGNGAKDNQILKFTKAGTFVMQIGRAARSTGNADTGNLNRPADVFVDPRTNELFVADGYGNRRIIVFDADTGRFKRMWGAFGKAASDAAPNPANADESEDGASQFVQPVHAARVSNDGLVYVSDRGGKRVQVFTIDGRYVSQVFIGRECKAPACGNGQTAAATAFSADPQQRFLYVGNAGQARVMVLDRKTLKVLDSFGRAGSGPGEFGTLHHLAADSKGNIYVTEVAPVMPQNRRVQKFRLLGIGR